jgi:hypothetical protein
MSKEVIYLFFMLDGGHYGSAYYYTQRDLDLYNGDWLSLFNEKGWSNTSDLGTAQILEGETPRQCFNRTSIERGWPCEGTVMDF